MRSEFLANLALAEHSEEEAKTQLFNERPPVDFSDDEPKPTRELVYKRGFINGGEQFSFNHTDDLAARMLMVFESNGYPLGFIGFNHSAETATYHVQEENGQVDYELTVKKTPVELANWLVAKRRVMNVA